MSIFMISCIIGGIVICVIGIVYMIYKMFLNEINTVKKSVNELFKLVINMASNESFDALSNASGEPNRIEMKDEEPTEQQDDNPFLSSCGPTGCKVNVKYHQSPRSRSNDRDSCKITKPRRRRGPNRPHDDIEGGCDEYIMQTRSRNNINKHSNEDQEAMRGPVMVTRNDRDTRNHNEPQHETFGGFSGLGQSIFGNLLTSFLQPPPGDAHIIVTQESPIVPTECDNSQGMRNRFEEVCEMENGECVDEPTNTVDDKVDDKTDDIPNEQAIDDIEQ